MFNEVSSEFTFAEKEKQILEFWREERHLPEKYGDV